MERIELFLYLLKQSDADYQAELLARQNKPLTAFEIILVIMIWVVNLAIVFAIGFAFKKLVYNRIVRAIKAKKRVLASR